MSSKLQLQRIFWIFPIAALTLAYVAQINYDAWRRYSPPRIATSYNIYIEPQPFSAQAAKTASLGSQEFMASLYWLQLIQYYGGGDPYGQYRKLAELFNTVTDLSPKFTHAYQTGLLVLPGEGFVDEAIALGKKGMERDPERWEMPYYTGIVYHIYKKDYVTAGKLFEQAAALPEAPQNAKYLAAIYYNRGDQRQTAYALFKTIYEATTDNFIKERSAKYILHLENIFLLEEKVAAFQQRFKRLPRSLNELVQTRLIEQLPTSPLGLTYEYNTTTGAITEEKP